MPGSARGDSSIASSNLIILNQCKNEEFSLISGFRQLHKNIRRSWRTEIFNGDELVESAFEKCRIFVFPCPLQFKRKFIHSGGSLLVMCAEGGEQRIGTNINFLLEEFGIAFNSDCVIRTMFHKYFYPKEALVPNGVINRAIPSVAGVQKAIISHGREAERNRKGQLPKEQIQHSSAFGQKLRNNGKDNDDEEEEETNICSALTFVYPFGCTLSVDRRSVCVLSTGTVCYPIARPICAFHKVQKENGCGKLAVGPFKCSLTLFSPKKTILFDLDDTFATHEIQLAQLTNRCAENELDLYIREAGEILDISKTLLRSERRTEGKITAKKVMEYVILHIVEWKKSTGGMVGRIRH
ncbi:hypothetical protein niasHT_016740 [Heterodera trifolii]|uniref:Uncharacterized protein n=1 Tax=Heterodera trifolii TaxID=157864 RepID=A0ABD2L7U2_9BILA